MKKIYLILSVFAIVFAACETDFDVNSSWEEVTVVYGLLDAGDGKELQQIKISKAFLGKMDALQMAQYADSINFDPNDLDVKIVRIINNGITDTVSLVAVPTFRDGDLFYDTVIIYTFENTDAFLQSNSEYELVIKNKISGNIVISRTEIISGFNFDMGTGFPFGFIETWIPGNPSATKFSSTNVTWGQNYPFANHPGEQYQIDLIFNYKENNITKSLTYTTSVIESASQFLFEGDKFFNFLKNELSKDMSGQLERNFIDIDLVMTVGSEDLKIYRTINEEITGIVQERPQFTNINNGIGLFSSRFTKKREGFDFAERTLDYLISIDGLDRNFK